MFAPDFKALPYWWDRTPRPELGRAGAAGARRRGGRRLRLYRAERGAADGARRPLDAGDRRRGRRLGLQTRNGGQVTTSVKPSFAELAQAHGEERAARHPRRKGIARSPGSASSLRAERIDCDYRVGGRFHAAHSARQYEALARHVANPPTGIDLAADLVPRSEQAKEIGTDAYHGGVVIQRHAALDPARYHRGLLERVIAAGATIVPHCAATAIERQSGGFRVTTSRGDVTARDVIVGTNAYTGRVTPWLRRRVIPIGSYIIATEPIAARDDGPPLADRPHGHRHAQGHLLLPRLARPHAHPLRRARVLERDRPADQRAAAPGRDGRGSSRSSPDVRVSHSWMGFVAFTFDTLMHTGTHDGVHYATGYCGSGVGMASYLGMKLGLKVLGRREGETAFDGLPFPTRPYYFGTPWFLGAAIAYYRWHDRHS